MMTPPTKRTEGNGTIDQVTASADHAIKSTQRVVSDAFDSLSDGVKDVRDHAAPLLDRSTEQLAALAQRGLNAVHDTSAHLRDRALRASDTTVSYIKDEPVKAMLIAAATGAALMALIGLMSRTRDRN